MKESNLFQYISISNYIKLYLLEHNIFDKIKIYHYQNFTLINYILHYFSQFYYKINKEYMVISNKNNLNLLSSISFKSCHNNSTLKDNPCKKISINNNEQIIYYNIIVGFHQSIENNNKNNNKQNIKRMKLLLPNNLIQLKCIKKNKKTNYNKLEKIVHLIEKILKKEPLIKKYISYVILEESFIKYNANNIDNNDRNNNK